MDFIASVSAYRIQELAYGALSEETIERLDALADELEGKAYWFADPATLANGSRPVPAD